MSDRLAVMNAGRVLQVGSPHQIYDHPAERFVANFIGDTNFLQADYLGIEQGRARVRLASGAMLSAALPEGSSPNGKVTIVVRPEHAAITEEPDQGTISGMVENVVYFGTDTHFHLRLDGGEEFVIRRQNRRDSMEALTRGARAGILIGDDSAQVLKD